MPETGYIQVHAYAGDAELPLQDVAITVTARDGTAIGARLTDRSGRIVPIEIPTPPLDESQSPGSPDAPFTSVHLHARLRGYEQIDAVDVQIFSGTVTLQDLEMIPLSELPAQWDKSEQFDTPPQNL